MPAGLAVLGMWLYLHWFVAGRERATAFWRGDHWDTSSKQTQGLLRNKSLLLDLQREAWLEVARPLQKYCLVVLVFKPVYFVAATEVCVGFGFGRCPFTFILMATQLPLELAVTAVPPEVAMCNLVAPTYDRVLLPPFP